MDNAPNPQDDIRDWLALLYAPAIGCVHYQHLLAHFPAPTDLFQPEGYGLAEQLQLPAKTLKYLKHPDWQRVDKDLRWAQDNHCHIISFHDSRYPALLKEIPDPPPLLFIRGNPTLLSQPQIAIVGSRNPSPGGRQTAQDFAQGLSDAGLVISSGLALGIDAASHQGALASKGAGGGTTIAIAGTGPDRIYPARHRDLGHEIIHRGAIVTEFPPGTPPLAANFPRRNRIISGLSLGTLVVEAALRSGSLITARLAAEQGREVFAIPGSIHNPLARGCHSLIRQGVKLTEDITHILEELGPLATTALAQLEISAKTHISIAGQTTTEIDFLVENMGYEPTAMDTLIERSGLTPDSVSAMLLSLELEGRITSSGGLYSRTD